MNLNAYDRMAIKNAAKAVSHFMAKKQTLVQKQQDLQSQIDELDNTIVEYSKAVVDKTGYQPLELVEKVGTTWTFKYPDTIIPTVSTPEMVVEKEEDDEEKKEVEEKVEEEYVEVTRPTEEETNEFVEQQEINQQEEKLVDPFNELY